MQVLHRVRVFVYRFEDAHPSYLLLHSAQGAEGLWRPVHGNIEFSEQFETAVRREVLEETGLVNRGGLVDLELPLRQLLGDEEVVHWNFGFHAERVPEVLQLDHQRWDQYRWSPFDRAFTRFGLEDDRVAVTRLHALLHAA
jgi:8-oxo-dGTP pyrophosphatase MutT (NUDIX family)